MSIVRSVDHDKVIARIVEESGWSPRYVFMTMMSAGIAVLGLLLSSPAVVIGAMLISPLMSPILGLGFALALFDFAEMRRSMTALAIGTLAAVAFTVVIVMASPLQATTAEILARTRPSLFDLLVALFAALAGTFAIIRGRGETIVGVAIATALMPPLAVVGYGIATWNMPVLAGSTALFVTNFVTIALAAMILARFYGFGHSLSHRQSWAQTVLLFAVFVAMAVPLALSLEQIARESLITNQVRNTLAQRFGDERPRHPARNRLRRRSPAGPLRHHRAASAPKSRADLRAQLQTTLGRPVRLQLDQVLLTPGAGAIDAQRAELRQSSEAGAAARAADHAVARIVSMAAGVDPERITLDHDHRRVMATAAVLPGAESGDLPSAGAARLSGSGRLGRRVGAASGADAIGALRQWLRYTRRSGDAAPCSCRPGPPARWNIPALAVPGLPPTVDDTPTLAERRGLAIAALLRERGVRSVPAPAVGREFRLAAAVLEPKP